jgi:hypothetical protein
MAAGDPARAGVGFFISSATLYFAIFHLREEIRHYNIRHTVKPDMTG